MGLIRQTGTPGFCDTAGGICSDALMETGCNVIAKESGCYGNALYERNGERL